MHGCNFERWAPEAWYLHRTNLVQYAATNDLIVLFPMATECWNHRFNNEEATYNGNQVQAIMAMI